MPSYPPREGGKQHGTVECGKPAEIMVEHPEHDDWFCRTCARRIHPVEFKEMTGIEAEARRGAQGVRP